MLIVSKTAFTTSGSSASRRTFFFLKIVFIFDHIFSIKFEVQIWTVWQQIQTGDSSLVQKFRHYFGMMRTHIIYDCNIVFLKTRHQLFFHIFAKSLCSSSALMRSIYIRLPLSRMNSKTVVPSGVFTEAASWHVFHVLHVHNSANSKADCEYLPWF